MWWTARCRFMLKEVKSEALEEVINEGIMILN